MDEAENTRAGLGEPVRDGGPGEAAHYIMGATAELSLLARTHKLEMLGYLLDMAHMEAGEAFRRRRNGSL